MLTTSICHHATPVADVSQPVGKQGAMGMRKSLANKVLGQNVDELCLAWYQQGLKDGFESGMDTAINDIVTDLLSDAVLAMELDTDTLRRIVEIIEN